MKNVKDAIAEGQVKRAMELFINNPAYHPALKDEVLILQSELAELTRQERLGLLSHDEIARSKARISNALLDICRKQETEDFPAASLSKRKTTIWLLLGSLALLLALLWIWPKLKTDDAEASHDKQEFLDDNGGTPAYSTDTEQTSMEAPGPESSIRQENKKDIHPVPPDIDSTHKQKQPEAGPKQPSDNKAPQQTDKTADRTTLPSKEHPPLYRLGNYDNQIITTTKGDLIVSLSMLNASDTFQYRIKRAEGNIYVAPYIPYLQTIDQGGPIRPRKYLLSPFDFSFPTFDFKVINNGSNTLYFTFAKVHVQSSRTDHSPVLIIYGKGADMQLPLKNIGWGKVSSCSILCNVSPLGQASEKVAYEHEIQVGPFERHAKISIAPIVEKIGRDKFDKDLAFVQGVIRYSCLNFEGKEVDQELTFETQVYLGMPGVGSVRPPSYDYDLKLELDKKNYTKTISMSQEIRANETDRFTFTIYSDKSSSHIFDLELYYNDNQKIVFPNIDMHYFMSKADTKFIGTQNSRDSGVDTGHK